MPRSNPGDDTLRRLLLDRTSAAVEKTMQAGGEIAEDEIAALGRLARLVELRRAAEPPAPRRVWPLVALGAGTLLIASLLLFARVGETEIELEIGATEVSFSLPSQQVLFENVNLASLGVSGLRQVTLPEDEWALAEGKPVERAALAQGAAPEEDAAIRIDALQDGARAGTIGIGTIVPGAGTEVWLRRGDEPAQYRLSLRNLREPVQVDIAGPVRIATTSVPARTLDLGSPRAVVLEAGTSVVDFDLVFVDLAKAGVTSQVPIERLGLRRVDEFGDRGLSIIRTISTVVSGTLFFESLNGLTRPLRSGEALRFERSTGEMRTMRLEPGHLTLNFHGRVRGIATGSDESPQSLMPTWLDWLRAQHGLSLLWGTSVYLFGTGLAVVRWFKAP
jgi:hypothetical protein